VDNEVSVSGAGGGCGGAGAGVAAGDIAKPGDVDLCWGNQSRSCAHADWDSAAFVGIEGGAVSEGEEFAPDVVGVSGAEEAVLGPASMGSRVLGSDERECDGRSVEEVHRGPKAGATGRQFQGGVGQSARRPTVTGLSRHRKPSPSGDGRSPMRFLGPSALPGYLLRSVGGPANWIRSCEAAGASACP